jgi:hypothetical protein
VASGGSTPSVLQRLKRRMAAAAAAAESMQETCGQRLRLDALRESAGLGPPKSPVKKVKGKDVKTQCYWWLPPGDDEKSVTRLQFSRLGNLVGACKGKGGSPFDKNPPDWAKGHGVCQPCLDAYRITKKWPEELVDKAPLLKCQSLEDYRALYLERAKAEVARKAAPKHRKRRKAAAATPSAGSAPQTAREPQKHRKTPAAAAATASAGPAPPVFTEGSIFACLSCKALQTAPQVRTVSVPLC